MRQKKRFWLPVLIMLALLVIVFFYSWRKPEVQLIRVHPYDSSLFTQGLELSGEGQLIVGTGLYGDSRLGFLDPKAGSFKLKTRLGPELFGEGITQTPAGIWQLTWKAGQAFLRDSESFEIIKTCQYSTEGWGIAYNPGDNLLYMSDGSNQIQIRDPESFELIDGFELNYQAEPLVNINELEICDNFLFANIWQSMKIVKIDLDTRQIVKVYDLSQVIAGLDLTAEQRESMDVLNGIAHIEGRRFYLAGKLYPILLEVELN